jgi:hypothetical protein
MFPPGRFAATTPAGRRAAGQLSRGCDLIGAHSCCQAPDEDPDNPENVILLYTGRSHHTGRSHPKADKVTTTTIPGTASPPTDRGGHARSLNGIFLNLNGDPARSSSTAARSCMSGRSRMASRARGNSHTDIHHLRPADVICTAHRATWTSMRASLHIAVALPGAMRTVSSCSTWTSALPTWRRARPGSDRRRQSQRPAARAPQHPAGVARSRSGH